MLKRILSLFILPVLLGGCTTTTLTNLTPQQQVRNENNVYPVEVALSSRQQTIRWDSIRPQIMVGDQFIPMQPTSLMTNRWEGTISVAPGTSVVHYRYKFDFDRNQFGGRGQDSVISDEFVLRIIDR